MSYPVKRKKQYQIALPLALKEEVPRELHIPMTYLGAERTFQTIRKRFYWPKTEEEVR